MSLCDALYKTQDAAASSVEVTLVHSNVVVCLLVACQVQGWWVH